MTVATVGVNVYFGLANNGEDVFTIEDAVHGLIENDDSLIAGDVGTGLEAYTYDLRVTRGRNRELDEFDAGRCEVKFRNHTRAFDDTNAASPYFGNVTPGKRTSVTIWGQQVFGGVVEDWDNEWFVDQPATATMFAVDGLGELGVREFAEWTTTGAQTAGERIEDALNRAEINFGVARDIDDGVSSLQADSVTWGSNALNYLQLVADSDSGRLFASRTNVLRFQDRLSLLDPATTVEFRDDGTGIKFHGVATAVGADLLFNRVGVDREGGTLQTAEDTTSQTAIGVRALSKSGLLMDTDETAAEMADWLLNLYRTPETRVASIMVKVNALSASDRGTVTGLDIGDVVSISWTPQGVGAALEQTLVIEGVEHQVNETGMHVMWLHTSLSAQFGVFTIEDDTYGLIETGGVIPY